MIIDFKLKGSERKPLVKALGELLNVEPKYLGGIAKAYRIGDNTLTFTGEFVLGNTVDGNTLLTAIKERGFIPANVTGISVGTIRPTTGFTVEIPKDKVNVENLEKLIAAKGKLLKKALSVENLPIKVSEETVSFPWFREVDSDSAKAYTHLISALCEMSVTVRNISAKEKDIENEKYAFRCFLLRLGFIGTEFKGERKVLLKNLTGSSAFKNGGVESENSEQEND